MGVDTHWLAVLRDPEHTLGEWRSAGRLEEPDSEFGADFRLTYEELGLPGEGESEHVFALYRTADPRLIVLWSSVRSYRWQLGPPDPWTADYCARVRRFLEPHCERIVLATEHAEPEAISELDALEQRYGVALTRQATSSEATKQPAAD